MCFMSLKGFRKAAVAAETAYGPQSLRDLSGPLQTGLQTAALYRKSEVNIYPNLGVP